MNGLRRPILRWTRGVMLRASPILLVLGACSEVPPVEPEESEDPVGTGLVWAQGFVREFRNSDSEVVEFEDSRGGPLSIVRELGGQAYPGTAPHPAAVADVFMDATGETFWVSAEAPSQRGPDPDDPTLGAEAALVQIFKFRKQAPNAVLRFVVSATQLELLDDNSQPIDTPSVCPWGSLLDLDELCFDAQSTTAWVNYDAAVEDSVDANGTRRLTEFWRVSGQTSIVGFSDKSEPRVTAGPGWGGGRPLFNPDLSDFEIERAGAIGNHVTVRLKSPIVVDVPIDTLALDTEFEVTVISVARVWTRRQGEVYVSAFFRDPANISGLSIEFEGLTLLEPPADPLNRISTVPPAPACAGGAGGTIQFDSTAYYKPEWPGDERHFAEITVTRTASGGEASALFTTSDGTATGGPRDEPGSDYEPVSTHIRFDAGEAGTQAVYVPIIGDLASETDETVMLTLSDPSGCAGLGDVTSATLTIRDDDNNAGIDDTYAVGGTVTGLEGTGLRLRNISALATITENGTFEFPGRYPTGDTYDVTVEEQPSGPLQVCAVENGQGTVGTEDVTDILVTCVTPAGGDALDPGFGTGGIVEVNISPNPDDRFAMRVALQDDGKILAVGHTELVRYDADGSADTGFGTDGAVTVVLAVRPDDQRLRGVAVQPDGRILVAGVVLDGVNLPGNDNFALARYEADGTPDTGFGNGGVVITDFNGRLDAANGIVIQSDGAIVLAGYADAVDQFGTTPGDFGVVRLLADGTPDTDFGVDGLVAVDFFAGSDEASDVVIQPDGKILVGGKIDNGSRVVGLARVLP